MCISGRILRISAIALSLFASQSHAVTLDLYSDRTGWLATQGGSSSFLETFNSYTVETSFAASSVSFNGFSLMATEASPTGGNKVDIFPYGPGISAVSGTNTTPQANIQVSRAVFPVRGVESTVSMIFASPIVAWGADFEEIGVSEIVELKFGDGSTQILQLPESQTNPEFLGFVATGGVVTELTFGVGFLPSGNPIFGGFGGLMDNVEGTTAIAPIPLPATLPLILASILLLGFGTRRAGR